MYDRNKKIDGHAAGIKGDELNVYLTAGIKTDHEATTVAEAKERLALGMYLMVREGTVAKDLESLLPAITAENSRRCLFVTDDKLIDDLVSEGSIDHIIRRAIQLGMDPLQAIQMATLNAAECFGLKNLGAVAPGYQADFFLTDDLTTLSITDVFVRGKLVVRNNLLAIENFPTHMNPYIEKLPKMNVQSLSLDSFALPISSKKAHVIEIIPNSLLTKDQLEEIVIQKGQFVPSIKNDQLKIAVIERHHRTGNIGVGIVKGFQLKKGALATTVAHDSHNIVVVGTNDADMLVAANRLIQTGGGMIVVENGQTLACLPLPIGGLMSQDPFSIVNEQLIELTKNAYQLGASQSFDQFLTLSFLTLSVIPELKITDKGLFSFSQFRLIEPSL